MSAEILRAASLMRERAEAATSGPWIADGIDVRGRGNWMDADFVLGFDACPTPPDAAYIASWHPAVALAVADWLEDTAAVHDDPYYRENRDDLMRPALAVARAYLGESA